MTGIVRSTPSVSGWFGSKKNFTFHGPLSSLPSLTSSFRVCSSRNTCIPAIEKVQPLSAEKKHSVILPLGSQKVYVPSKRMKAEWQRKIEIANKYLSLSQSAKELKIMELSLKKFCRTTGMPSPEIKSDFDIKGVYEEVCKIVERDSVSPMPLAPPSDPNYPNYEECIVGSINRYFAKKDFQSDIRIQSVTEYCWHHVLRRDYAFPFTDKRDDLSKMIEMALPHLNATTLFHEAGCGSGEGLIETLFRGYGLNHMPGIIVGSDVNPYSLESIKILVEELFGGLENVFLKYGNAADSLELDEVLKFTPEVVVIGANRFFSILEPHTFSSIVKGFSKQICGKGYLVAGITVISEQNLQDLSFFERDKSEYLVEDSDLGIVVHRKQPFRDFMKKEGLSEEELVNRISATTQLPVSQVDISKAVHQVFYHPNHFREKMTEYGFEEESSRFVEQSDHFEREVVLFKKRLG